MSNPHFAHTLDVPQPLPICKVNGETRYHACATCGLKNAAIVGFIGDKSGTSALVQVGMFYTGATYCAACWPAIYSTIQPEA